MSLVPLAPFSSSAFSPYSSSQVALGNAFPPFQREHYTSVRCPHYTQIECQRVCDTKSLRSAPVFRLETDAHLGRRVRVSPYSAGPAVVVFQRGLSKICPQKNHAVDLTDNRRANLYGWKVPGLLAPNSQFTSPRQARPARPTLRRQDGNRFALELLFGSPDGVRPVRAFRSADALSQRPVAAPLQLLRSRRSRP